ncbi:MAG: coiled coil domain-containing protein [Gammaproteobacteria bacterium]|jgi:predicted  nucleic acid-binding Zn-ribbon protein|nr:coiled coil domain-containing protein [Gammaproteobacteria bacterium]
MSRREQHEGRLQAQLDEVKAEITRLREKLEQAEINLELEYYTLIDELQVQLQATERKFELLKQADEEKWEEFKSEFEHSWQSLRELIKAITAP